MSGEAVALSLLSVVGTITGALVVAFLKKIANEMVTIRDGVNRLSLLHDVNTKVIDDHESRLRKLELEHAG